MTPTPTPTATGTASFSATETATPTPTASLTATPTLSVTVSPTITQTFTVSPTATLTTIRFYEQPDIVIERGLYPNPFIETLKIFFTLRVEAAVELTVYNVAGEVVYLQVEDRPAGKNVLPWRGANSAGAKVASGIYLVRVRANGVDLSSGEFWATAVVAR